MSLLSVRKGWLPRLAGLSLLLLSSISTAMAQDIDINFAGFASVVYAKTITDDKKEGEIYGMSNEGEYRDFNRLGFRMDADMKNNLSFTGQILALGSDNYDPTFDWLFATYQFNPEVALSAGRIRMPLFLFSDFIDTTYAYPWIEPPRSVYDFAQTPFRSFEGLKLAYTTDIGSWTSELLLWSGKTQDRFTETGVDADLTLEKMAGIAWTVGYEWLSLRGVYTQADTSLDLTTSPAVAGLMQSVQDIELLVAGASGGKLIPNFHDPLLWEKDPGQFYGLSATLDFETYFLIMEATRIDMVGKDSNLVTPRLDSYYITAGVRLPAQVSLSLTFAEDKDYVNANTWKHFRPWLAPNGLLGGPDGAVGSQRLVDTNGDNVINTSDYTVYEMVYGLAQGVMKTVIDMQDYKSQTSTLAIRWDFHPSASAKFEFIYNEHQGLSSGTAKQKPQAVRLGLDFVF